MMPQAEKTFLKIAENIFCFLLLLLVTVHETKDVVIKFRITNYHTCVSTYDILQKVSQVSVRQCVEECVTMPNCSAVSYWGLYKLCGLHSTFDEHFVGIASTKGPCIYVNRSDIFVEKPQVNCDLCASDENCDLNYCERKFCPRLKLEDGDLLGNMNSVGSRVEYTCNSNFVETAGKTHSTCQDNGAWTHEPKCVKNFIYMGCYEDKDERILYEKEMRSSTLTTETCVNFCFGFGYVYALTESNDECYCGNTPRDYPKKDDSECNTPCTGDPNEMCGGVWRGSLYKRI